MIHDKKKLALEIEKACLLRGSFQLRSGQISDFYFDKYRFESSPLLLGSVAFHLAPMLPEGADFLGGLELGGAPMAAALSLQTKIPCVFVRKKAKNYGTKALAEGAPISNKKITLIEDVITTGGQVCMSAEDLRKKGAVVENVLCVIHRSRSHTNENLKKMGLHLKSLFHLSDFKSL